MLNKKLNIKTKENKKKEIKKKISTHSFGKRLNLKRKEKRPTYSRKRKFFLKKKLIKFFCVKKNLLIMNQKDILKLKN